MNVAPLVLVIEDNPDISMFVRISLELEGCRVVSVGDGLGALEQLDQHRPEVILLDAQLHRSRAGWDVLQAVQHVPAWAAVPVVVLSRDVSTATQIQAWQRGAAAFLAMPFSPVELSDTVRRVTAEPPADRELRRIQRLDHLSGPTTSSDLH